MFSVFEQVDFLMLLIVLLYVMRQLSVFWWAQSRSHLWLAEQREYPTVVCVYVGEEMGVS